MSGDLADLVGIPFLDKGRTKAGADCFGLFALAMERFGVEVPAVDVSAFASEEVFLEFRKQVVSWAKVNEPRPGDAVTLRNDPNLPDLIQHFGVYVGEGRFLHSLEKTGSIITRIDHPFWKNRIEGFYRWNR